MNTAISTSQAVLIIYTHLRHSLLIYSRISSSNNLLRTNSLFVPREEAWGSKGPLGFWKLIPESYSHCSKNNDVFCIARLFALTFVRKNMSLTHSHTPHPLFSVHLRCIPELQAIYYYLCIWPSELLSMKTYGTVNWIISSGNHKPLCGLFLFIRIGQIPCLKTANIEHF